MAEPGTIASGTVSRGRKKPTWGKSIIHPALICNSFPVDMGYLLQKPFPKGCKIELLESILHTRRVGRAESFKVITGRTNAEIST